MAPVMSTSSPAHSLERMKCSGMVWPVAAAAFAVAYRFYGAFLAARVAVLSGPSFAQEVYERRPTLVVAAAALFTFPPTALEELKRQTASEIEAQRDDPEALVSNALARHGDPYPLTAATPRSRGAEGRSRRPRARSCGSRQRPRTPSVSPGGKLTRRPFQPLGNVAVDIYAQRCFPHRLDDPRCPINAKVAKIIRGWQAMVEPQRVSWGDLSDDPEFLPRPKLRPTAADLRWLAVYRISKGNRRTSTMTSSVGWLR